MTKQYGSEALAAAHEAALGLAEAGLMSKRRGRGSRGERGASPASR